MGSRLTRGKSYARKGQVLSLEVASGVVRARVQGSRRRPYEVRIGFAPLPPLVWAKAEIALSEEALASAKLLAGEVPPELEEVFAAAGAALFPATAEDLEQSCSCPDWEVPCKHLAATFYLLAEAFDTDPFLILRWRGRDRDELLGRLRELRTGSTSSSDEGVASPVATATIGTGIALAGTTWTGADAGAGERFWQPPPPLPDPPPVLSADPDLLLRQLPTPSPALGGEALLERLRSAYAILGADR